MNNPKINIPEFQLNELIVRAAKATRDKDVVDKLFLVVPVERLDMEGETKINTKYGKLLVFFCHQLDQFQAYGKEKPTGLLLHHGKFPYPKVSRVSVKPFQDLPAGKSHLVH